MVKQCSSGMKLKEGRCVRKRSKVVIFLSIGIVLALIIGVVVGAMVFPRTKIVNVPTDSGDFCFSTDIQGELSILTIESNSFKGCIDNEIVRVRNDIRTSLGDAIATADFNEVISVRDSVDSKVTSISNVCGN